jgi:tetratricopeptide (TPR) repeat protein
VVVTDPELLRLVPAVDALAARLGAIESSLALQHQRALETRQETARTILLVAACLAGAALLGALLASLILARAVRRMSDMVVAVLPPARQLGPGSWGSHLPAVAGAEPGPGEFPAAVEQAGAKFLGAIEQLEKRIVELEHSTQNSAHLPPGTSTAPGANGGSTSYEFSVSALQQKQYPEASGPAGVLVSWIGKGQALLNLGQAEEALTCFDKALELNPTHAETHVKRGMALEKLGKFEAAMTAYDQALAADRTFTLAYLYKGAVCNRLQRFREAVECYENALKSEQNSAAA